jgi:hypothetical protein
MSGARTSALLAHMAAIDADVWVLTETRTSLAPGSAFERIAASADAPDRGEGERWTTVWVRGGIHGEQIAASDPERTACARLHLPEGDTLYIYGTVLPWLSDTRRDPLRGAASFISAVTEQSADWRRIRDREPQARLCVVGDLNQDLLPHGHFYGSAAGRRALRESLAEADLTCITGGAADPVALFGGGRASVDHICLTDVTVDVDPESLQLAVWPQPHELGPKLSDHHGIVATVAPHNRLQGNTSRP